MTRLVCAAHAIAVLFTGLFFADAGAQSAAPRVTEQQSNTTQLLQAVHAVNERVVWASGHGGVVLRTVDGGEHWEKKATPAGDSIQFRDVHALNADTAWIMSAGTGTASRIYYTMNGGASWTLQIINPDTAAFYDCMTFLDHKTGIVFSDATNNRTNVLRTDDGGVTWGLLAQSAVPAPLPNEGAFASSGLCVVASDARHVFITTGSPGARVMYSSDAGQHWRVENTPFVRSQSAGLTGIAFKDRDHAIMVGADIGKLRTDTSSAVIGVTSNAGRTWTMRTRPPLPGALSGVAWVPGAGADVAVVVGFGGAFYTTDAARTWTTLNDKTFTGVAAFGRTAWMGGAGGRIVRLDW